MTTCPDFSDISVYPFNRPDCMGPIGSSQYNNIAGNYCGFGSNMFIDQNCKQWLMQNIDTSLTAKNIIENKCNTTNLMREPCKTIIQQGAMKSPVYDNKIIEYCRYNPNDKNCSCINRPKNSKLIICADPKCSSITNPTLYKTFAQNNEKTMCCNQSFNSDDLIATGGSAITVNQICGGNNASVPVVSSPVVSNPVVSSPVVSQYATNVTPPINPLMILVLLLFITIVIGIGYYLFKPNNNKYTTSKIKLTKLKT
jgi:hypothetical protein